MIGCLFYGGSAHVEKLAFCGIRWPYWVQQVQGFLRVTQRDVNDALSPVTYSG